ncbi:MAG: [FeFe] hydrogenase H-cluster radical SAM maturase HydE [Oscillospiraceae bacterium]|nr:[FeFe] hydrogenase H-cluster radical SAM maturase HydE [Oscillospiraceae bacterium]
MRKLIDKLAVERTLTQDEFKHILSGTDPYLQERAAKARDTVYGKQVFIRGLIEFTNYCKHDCYYCGLRCSNTSVPRYRLSLEQILDCCRLGYDLGFRTFVLQGGEDEYYTDDATLASILCAIKEHYPDCAITLSVGERSRASYKRLFDAGADRYLLRHETADAEHYSTLHPAHMKLASRKQCLQDLKEIGYQVGCGFMVGSPEQTLDHLAADFLFIKELDPHMVGIGPFIPHADTPCASEKAGGLQLTLNALSILRLMNPNLLLPSTTALGTIAPNGRELGVLAGANVVMPNLSPMDTRKKYLLYDGKISTDDDPRYCRDVIDRKLQAIGYEVVTARGDYIDL